MSENPDDARFTDREVRLIFERAGQLDTASTGDRRFSLAELQEIGAQAGLNPADIASAATSVRVVRSTHRFLGAPARFASRLDLEGRVSDAGVNEIVGRMRGVTRTHGSLKLVPGGVEWTAQTVRSAFLVSFTPTKKGSQVDIVVAPRDDVVATVVAGSALGLTIGVITTTALALQAPGAVAGPLLVGAVTAGLTMWGSVRVLWARAARRWAGTREQLENAALAPRTESESD